MAAEHEDDAAMARRQMGLATLSAGLFQLCISLLLDAPPRVGTGLARHRLRIYRHEAAAAVDR